MLILAIHEADAIAPLQAALAAGRPLWRLVVHDDPADARRLAAEQSFDVIACGWRIGRTFGPEVLRRAQAVAPDAMRLLLLPASVDSGEAARQSLACAHQSVLLSEGAPRFAASMERLIAVRWLLRNPALRRAIGGAERLPAAPRLFLALQQVIADPLAGTTDAARLVARDSALSSRVLRIANSALFARSAPVLDVAGAAAQVGLDVLARIVLACEVYSRGATRDPDAEVRQHRAMAAARLAARIASDPVTAQCAATAALLADCALPLLPGLDRAALRAVTPPRLWAGLPDQALVAAYLLGLWGLPHPLIEAAVFCHAPGRLPNPVRGVSAAGALHIARALVHGEAPDADWINGNDLGGQLGEWRSLAASLEGRSAASEALPAARRA
ncbi:MAG: HDOD domain-containing protein [Pseudomonadota bacterium]